MPPLLQFSNCRGPRLALISVPSHKIPSAADITVAKTVCILIMEILLAKEKPVHAGLGPVQPHVLSQHYIFLF